MTNEEIKRLVNRAYAKGYRMVTVEDYDCDVNGIMWSLNYKGYFDFDSYDEVRNTVKAKLERLYKRLGYDPYWESNF